jgi:preprotein translocase subunit SecY
MWLGELITQRGIGNGISLMIFASIAARLPHGISAWWTNPDQVFKVLMPFLALAIIAGIVFMQEGQRRIPIQYARRQLGNRQTASSSTYMPLSVVMAGVIPIIFAAAILAVPQTLGSFEVSWNNWLQKNFSYTGWHYLLVEALLIIMMTYFYTSVVFNPVEQADNLRKYNGYIPGIRPGPPTAAYFDRVLKLLTFPGALFLAAVAVAPSIFISHFHFSQATYRALGGTSVLIVVGVALQTMRQMESQMVMRHYEGFLR